jgi:hypothetical protein
MGCTCSGLFGEMNKVGLLHASKRERESWREIEMQRERDTILAHILG